MKICMKLCMKLKYLILLCFTLTTTAGPQSFEKDLKAITELCAFTKGKSGGAFYWLWLEDEHHGAFVDRYEALRKALPSNCVIWSCAVEGIFDPHCPTKDLYMYWEEKT